MATIFIVGTPIGNLSDITARAVDTLKSVALILAEDTRVTKKLTVRYDINVPIAVCHQHSSEQSYIRAKSVLDKNGDVALVTDAGTPGISDPGGKLVRYIVENTEHEVVPIPGVSALTTALSVAGFPTDRFTFYGFLPHKKGRQKMLKEILSSTVTTIFFESPHRIMKTLDYISEYAQKEKKIVIVREATKKFESIYRGSTNTVDTLRDSITTRGEFTIVIGPG